MLYLELDAAIAMHSIPLMVQKRIESTRFLIKLLEVPAKLKLLDAD